MARHALLIDYDFGINGVVVKECSLASPGVWALNERRPAAAKTG